MEEKKKRKYTKRKKIEKKSEGVGDTIAKITDTLGIKKCKGCEQRQKKLNKIFPYKKDISQEDIQEINAIEKRIEETKKLSVEDSRFILKILKNNLGMSVKPCYNCGKASWLVWLNKIKLAYDKQ